MWFIIIRLNSFKIITWNTLIEETTQIISLYFPFKYDFIITNWEIIEKGNELYLFDKTEGVFVFDIYGNYKSSLVIKADDSIQIVNASIAYTSAGVYKVLSWDRITETSTPLPQECKSMPHYFGNAIHFLDNNTLRVYKIKE